MIKKYRVPSVAWVGVGAMLVCGASIIDRWLALAWGPVLHWGWGLLIVLVGAAFWTAFWLLDR